MTDTRHQAGPAAATDEAPRVRFSPEEGAWADPAGPRNKLWTTREIRVLRETYPTAGIDGCLAAMPGRTARSVYEKASELGLVAEVRRANPGRRRVRRNYAWTPERDDAIRRAYAQGDKSGAVKRLSVATGIPRRTIGQRAQRLGIAAAAAKDAGTGWTHEQDAILLAFRTKLPSTIRAKLVKAGHPARTEGAITTRLWRLRASRRPEGDPDTWSGQQLAELMGVATNVVSRWIADGILPARRGRLFNGWAIRRRDVRGFLIANTGRWDHRKCEKQWLVETLTGADLPS